MSKLTDSQRAAVDRVYKEIEDYLYLFAQSEGFAWNDYRVPDGSVYAKYIIPSMDISTMVKRDSERLFGYVTEDALQKMTYEAARDIVYDEGEEFAQAAYDWVCHSLDREWVELGNHPIYEELEEYIGEAMLEVWNGKTYDPQDRYVQNMDGTVPFPPISVEVARALKGTRDIISKYL